jgi:polysaccharide biosynthesis/export protein
MEAVFVDQRASSHSVQGEVRGAGRFAVSASCQRLLEAIARAGGLTGQRNESWGLLEREGQPALAPFGAIVDVPANNIDVRATTPFTSFVSPRPSLRSAQSVPAPEGATTITTGLHVPGGQFPFDTWRVTLSVVLAKTIGLSDLSANPSSVFLYRGETRHVAQLLGSTARWAIKPIIYNINMRNPAGYFLASMFEMRNKGAAVPVLDRRDAVTATLRGSRRKATYRTLIDLLVVTDMRIEEAIGLNRNDFDANCGVLTIRNGKFGKSRELP